MISVADCTPDSLGREKKDPCEYVCLREAPCNGSWAEWHVIKCYPPRSLFSHATFHAGWLDPISKFMSAGILSCTHPEEMVQRRAERSMPPRWLVVRGTLQAVEACSS